MSWVYGFINVVVVFIIVCLCVFGFVIFMFIMVVSGKGVIFGVLFCDVVVIENLCKVDMFIVDKIGMFIEGKLVFECSIGINGFFDVEVLWFVVSFD